MVSLHYMLQVLVLRQITLVTRDSESEVTMSTSLDALFAEDDNVIVSDDSDSDGYLSEVKDLAILSGDVDDDGSQKDLLTGGRG
ncbi:hypothetical protein L6452_06590 [Arctium lappa]|uniref:Uncharacterized protein n=1 Tax=Arctium lappa TaxID=4217 RepID=A0ACB9EJL9_ARCLA|nr:hypothetical protein L6452_06590 [Arctium lappa]